MKPSHYIWNTFYIKTWAAEFNGRFLYRNPWLILSNSLEKGLEDQLYAKTLDNLMDKCPYDCSLSSNL